MNNSTSFIIYALAIAVLIGVISTIIFKIHSKSRNSRIIKRIRKGDYCFDNLNELNDMESSRIEKGSKLYQAIILLFVIADAINYYVSFNSIYRENVFMLLILTMTLAIILDHAPNAIAEYIFSNEKTNTISVKNQRIITVVIGLLIAVIISFIVMLFKIRANTTDLVFDGSGADRNAQNAMVTLWSTVALGTTLASFTYSAITTLIIAPRMHKSLKHSMGVLAEALLAHLRAQATELEKYIDQEKTESDLIHEANVQKILSEHAFIVAMYKSNLTAQQNDYGNGKSIPRRNEFYAS